MLWIRHNWLGIVVLVAIVASFFIANNESHTRDRAQHSQLVQTCERGSQKSALLAAYQHRTAIARRQTGDHAIAADYDRFARANIDLIPVPAGVKKGDPIVAHVVRDADTDRFVLTPEALALQHAGCERTNP